MGLFFWNPRPIFDDFLKTKKMRNVCTINLAAVSRRDLYYVSENESFCFGQNIWISRSPDFQTPPPPPPPTDDPSDPNLTPLPTHPGIKYVARVLAATVFESIAESILRLDSTRESENLGVLGVFLEDNKTCKSEQILVGRNSGQPWNPKNTTNQHFYKEFPSCPACWLDPK